MSDAVLFEFVSGRVSLPAITKHIRETGVRVSVRNIAKTKESVQVIFHTGAAIADTATQVNDGTIGPGQERIFVQDFNQDSALGAGGHCWITVRTPSRTLVPSAEFFTLEVHDFESRYDAPGDNEGGWSRPTRMPGCRQGTSPCSKE
jgi:hypothetical protein